MTDTLIDALILSPQRWQQSLKTAITEPAELLEILNLPNDLLKDAQSASELFPLRVPREFVHRMEKGNVLDPLLQQVLPLGAEHLKADGFITDPLNEADARPLPGIVHKYKDRVLLILSGACAINCRYCFRRHFPYAENQLGGQPWSDALDYLRQHTDLREVVFSGGDPLVTSDARLARMIKELEAIPHLERLRIHTRLPVVIPSRITTDLCDLLSRSRFNTVVTLHINHPNEIDASLSDSARQLRSAGITVLNQAVVLKGVNDRWQVQVDLSRALFRAGILPYYLFAFDPVAGASHFDTPLENIQEMYHEMQRELPGYLLPKLAQEIPGKTSKTLLI